MRIFITFTIYLSCLNFALANESQSNRWLCSADDSTGFSLENTEWAATKFNLDSEKYLVRRLSASDGFHFEKHGTAYAVFEFGIDAPTKICKGKGVLFCRHAAFEAMGQFIFKPASGRFLNTYLFGYWGGDSQSDTPRLTKGKCTKL